jgi:hypothetical protein
MISHAEDFFTTPQSQSHTARLSRGIRRQDFGCGPFFVPVAAIAVLIAGSPVACKKAKN